MAKTDDYRKKLRTLEMWDEYLLQESGLPGPRGNLELAQVVADLGDRELFTRFLTFNADLAPTNSPYEFLAFCGAVGLGRLVAEGDVSHLPHLRLLANDSRWRMREAVATALQRVGDANMDLLLAEMDEWASGDTLEQRAAAAAVCEPRLLKKAEHTRSVLAILDKITSSILEHEDRKSETLLTLRSGLGYCWSVAVAALPEEGKTQMEKWLVHKDQDIRWIMRENLKKNRLIKMDLDWVEKWQKNLSQDVSLK
jgi:hypothetical protein